MVISYAPQNNPKRHHFWRNETTCLWTCSLGTKVVIREPGTYQVFSKCHSLSRKSMVTKEQKNTMQDLPSLRGLGSSHKSLLKGKSYFHVCP